MLSGRMNLLPVSTALDYHVRERFERLGTSSQETENGGGLLFLHGEDYAFQPAKALFF